MVIPELRVADAQVRQVATHLTTAATKLETVAGARPGAPLTGSARVTDAIANAVAVHAGRAAVVAQGSRAASEAARTSVDELDAAERVLVAALA